MLDLNTIITSLKALDEGFSSKNYVRTFLRALHPNWREKVTVIEESKDLSSLALDELIGNLKVHVVVMEKDSEIHRGKKERVKSIALKVKKKSSDDETLTSRSDDEEYAMVVRNFKKFFRRKGCGDPNHLIGDYPKPSCNKDQKAFIRGSWSDSENDTEDKTNDETYLMAQSSNEVTLNSSHYSDDASSLDNDSMLENMLGTDEGSKIVVHQNMMTDNNSLFSTYKAYDRVKLFGSNLKGKIIDKESVEARLLGYKKNVSVYEEDIKVLKREIHLREVAITELRRKLELAQKQKDEIQLTVENFKNSSKSLSKLIDCQIVDKCKTGLEYNAVPPPYIGNFMPLKPDLSFTSLEEFTSETVVENGEAKASEAKPKAVRKNNSAPIIEDWVSDSEEEDVPQTKIEKKIVKPSFAKIEFVKPKGKTARKTMKQFDHLQYDCDNHQRQFNNKKMVKPVWNYTQRVNHQTFSRMTHPSPKRNMVPKAVLMRSGLVSLTTAKPVYTAQPRTTVNRQSIARFAGKRSDSGPNWLFDIDALTKSMNYKPVVAGNQSNGNAGTKACDDTGEARMEIVPGKDYILLPLWTADPSFS
ncbi:hypothetical protein Tco_0266162 [Tanacetum coccineum]